MEVFFYLTDNKRSPVEDEIDSLPKQAAAHVYEILSGIEDFGLNASRVKFRQIQGKLWEIKMKIPRVGGYRIFYSMVEKDLMLLLHAYIKKSQRAPKKHIELARKRMLEAIERGL